MEGVKGDAGHFAGEYREAGCAFDFAVVGDDALGGAADDDLRVELEP